MFDWAARIDELDFHLKTQFRVDDRSALEILLSMLISCPATPGLWTVLETGWFLRDCAPGWFSFGGAWLPDSLPLLRAMRSRNANALLAQRLAQSTPALWIEPDFDRLPSYRRISEIRFLLARSLRLRVRSLPHGAAAPADLLRDQQRADQLLALTRAVVEDRALLRSSTPPAWAEPPRFFYLCELVTRLAGRHSDWGQTAAALRALAVRHAFLYGRTETDESDWSLLTRVAADMIPPWVARTVHYLLTAPDHRAQAATLQQRMCLDSRHHELKRLRRAGLLTCNQTQKLWELVPEHVCGVQDLVASRAFDPLSAPARSTAS